MLVILPLYSLYYKSSSIHLYSIVYSYKTSSKMLMVDKISFLIDKHRQAPIFDPAHHTIFSPTLL